MLDDVNVMVVEDEALIALDLSMTLEDMGARITGPFATIESALPACDGVDCAVLDVDLCGREVFPIADRLRATGKPFMFHTGRADHATLSDRYGADVLVVVKPSKGEDIGERIAALLALS